MPPFELILSDEWSPALVEHLEERLYEFNVQATGIADGRALTVVARDEDGGLIAGLAGHTWGECCEIRQLWVHEARRGQGLGRRLLESAEAEARRRSWRQIVLSTHSFQAPWLYAKLGFEVVGQVDGYPRGHAQIWLRKRLGGPKDDAV